MIQITKRNLPVVIGVAMCIEGLAIYLNMVAHPGSQPWLSIGITAANVALVGGLVWYRLKSGKVF